MTVQGTPARRTGGEFMGARLGRALELAQDDLPVANVLDDARRDAVQADEAQPAQDLLRREQARQLLLVAQAVLQVSTTVAGPTSGGSSWGNWSLAVVLRPMSTRSPGRSPPGVGRTGPHLEIAFRAVDAHALAPHGVVIRAQQEMDLVPGAASLAP